MKKYFLFTLGFFAVCFFANAQKQPYETIINGVKVIVQPSGNDIVEIRTIIKGGVQNYPENKAGIESLAMMALTECGTMLRDKNSFKNQLDEVSARVFGYAGKDYATFTMNCIKSDFDTVWPLYIEALTKPKFDGSEFARVKQDAINKLNALESEPDASIDKYAEKVAFAGQDYAKDPDGTVAIINDLKPEETKSYYDSVFTKSRLLIVIVANLDSTELASKLKTFLAGIKPGQPFVLKKSAYSTDQHKFAATAKELSTNYIEGITGGPQPGSKDFTTFSIAMRIFGNRHFLEIRTNHGLSYAPQSWFSGSATSSSRVAVSTTEPNKYIAVFNQLLNKIKKEGFTASEVKNMKTTYLTTFYYQQETNSAQAAVLAANEVLHDNWRRSIELMDEVKNITRSAVNKVFNTYMGNISWVYQGDTKKVNAILFTNNK